jgi:hypothetical protein
MLTFVNSLPLLIGFSTQLRRSRFSALPQIDCDRSKRICLLTIAWSNGAPRIILAGGAGERLKPFTALRAKPAVPFGGKYRIVDLVINNLINSGIQNIKILVQTLSQPLINHVCNLWPSVPVYNFLSLRFSMRKWLGHIECCKPLLNQLKQSRCRVFLEEIDISGAKGVLVNISGSSNMIKGEFDAASRIIHEKVQ